MSWLYTVFFAGLLLAADGQSPVKTNSNYTDSKIANVSVADESERFEQTYPLSVGGRVSVSNVNGSIAVENWDRNEVKLKYIKTADTKENLAEVTVRIDAGPDSISVETDYGDWKRRPSGERRSYSKLTVEYRLTVPRSAVLDQLATVNGSISIADVANVTKASAVNGAVRATNLSGTADLSTVNGTVVAAFDRLPAGGRISLNTVNGTVDLTIPSDADATVRADTVNGNITNDFGLRVRKGQYVGRDLHGKIGAGSAQIRLNSVNGGLSIKRKSDGKKLSPATDLLNLKSDDDDEDWDGANDSGVNLPKPPKPPKAPKTPVIVSGIDNEAIRRLVEQSLKEANKELLIIQPELEKQYAEALKQASAIDSEEMRAKLIEAQKRYGEAFAGMSDGFWNAGAPAVEKKTGSFAVKGTPKVTIDAMDCAVFVRGWDKPEVSYSVVRLSRSNRKSIDEEWTTSATKNNDSDISFKIASKIRPGDGVIDDGRTKTRLEIFVPRKSDLKITTGGEIRLEGVSGAIDLQGVDEAIDVRDANGKLSVVASGGSVRVIGFRGAFDASTNAGAINAEGDFQAFAARTVGGTIVLTLPENANVNIESNRKDLTGEGLTLAYQGDGNSTSRWKVGSGGANHLLHTTADGRVFVRSANALKAN